MEFYRNHYDAVIIGGALSGLACALDLQAGGMKDILILEKHNLPGGLATSYVRSGYEIEATLHEMMGIGSEDDRLQIGQFFDQHGIDIKWMSVPEAYRIVNTTDGVDITLHSGFERMSEEIEKQYPGWGFEVLRFMELCNKVYESMNQLAVKPAGKLAMLCKHKEFVKTCGYSAKEVMDTFHFPKEIEEILTGYWLYVGNPMETLPFTIYAFLMADYFRGGSKVCRNFSHEMSMKMEQQVEKNGAQIEFCQEVEKIYVKDGRVTGVGTKRGDRISCDYVISGAYPNRVFGSMIEPREEVPAGAYKMVNARRLSVCPVSVQMILDGTPEELGIKDYNLFSGDTMDTEEIWDNYHTLGPYRFLASICLNLANPYCTPHGKTQFSITALPLVNPFLSVKEEDYFDVKQKLAEEMIAGYERMSGTEIRSHIEEIEVVTPATISHFVGAWRGSVYGYSHSMDDHVVARLQMMEEDHFISGLEFAGAHGISGNGMGPAIKNGRAAARGVLQERERRQKEGNQE